jgi:Protein of unknown function (DUF2721)
MRLDELVPVLQLSVGPVIVISGVGLLLLSMTNRYGRVIDRARFVADTLRRAPGERAGDLQSQLQVLIRRGRLLKRAITGAALSLLFAALLIISLFVMGLAGLSGGVWVSVLFVACMVSLIVSLIVFIQDLNLSLAALDLEVRSAVVPLGTQR